MAVRASSLRHPVTDHWFEDLADHLGRAYLRYSFTKGTDQEVAFLVEALGLESGMRVLDVGCGPGRHSLALAARGIEVLGIDISERFVAIAQADTPEGSPASFRRLDARHLGEDPTLAGSFDAAISLCQGAFGLVHPGEDAGVLSGMAAALRNGGRVAVSAFSAYFQVRYPVEGAHFDARTGVNHEHTVIKDETGNDRPAELWTTCYTPRELGFLFKDAGLVLEHVWSVEPGDYGRRPPDVETPEFLAMGRR